MANSKSAMKRIENSRRKAEFNKNKRSALKTTLKKSAVALETSASNVAEIVKETQRELDRAVSRGLIHKNQAANKKSKLAKRLNALK